MADNAQKTPFARSLERFANQRARDAYNLTGKGLPCTVAKVEGSIITVNFDVDAAPFTIPNIKVPMFGPEYIRYPTQVGDKGVVVPFDVLLGAISGLGGNTARLKVPPSNLGALVFTAISNVNWSETDEKDAVVIYGPKGVILRDTGKNCKIVLDQENITVTAKTTLTLQVGSVSIVINSSGITLNGDVTVTGKFTSDGTTSLGGGAQAVKLADGSNATNVKAT